MDSVSFCMTLVLFFICLFSSSCPHVLSLSVPPLTCIKLTRVLGTCLPLVEIMYTRVKGEAA